MPIKTPTFTGLNVIPTGAGEVSLAAESKPADASLGKSPTFTPPASFPGSTSGNSTSSPLAGSAGSPSSLVPAGIVSKPTLGTSSTRTNPVFSVDTAKSLGSPATIFEKASSNGSDSTGLPGIVPGNISNAVAESTVFSYEASIYDTEITGSGITSAYPIIIGISPLHNLYTGGEESNYGVIYDIQNSIKQSSISQSNAIVEAYYATNPSAASYLASLRDSNLSKFNYLITNLPYLLEYRENIINAPFATTYLSSERTTIDGKIQAAQNGLGNTGFSEKTLVDSALLGSMSVLESITNIVSYDDISTYGSTNSPVVKSLSQRLLGDYEGESNNIGNQANTTRQYQLLRAAIAQISQGIRFDPESLNGSSSTSPYYDLEYSKIASIDRFLAENGTLGYGFPFAKSVLSVIGDTVANNFILSDSSLQTQTEVESFLTKYNLVYLGRLAKDSSGNIYVPNIHESVNNFFENDSNFYSGKLEDPASLSSYKRHLPIIGIREDILTIDLISQLAPVLAYEIMEQTKEIPYEPASVNPKGGTISVVDTALDSLRFITSSSSGKKVFIFDDSLQTTDGTADPISSVVAEPADSLQAIRSSIYSIKQSLYDFTDKNGHVLTDQCSLTILKTFYKYLSPIFSDTVLNGTKKDDDSATRIAMLMIAASNTESAARLFRIIADPTENSVRRISSGLSVDTSNPALDAENTIYSSPGSLVTGADSEPKISNEGYSIKGAEPTVLNFSLEKSMQDAIYAIFNESGSLFNFDKIVSELRTFYPVITEGSSLAKKIKFSAFTAFLYLLRRMKFEVSLSIDWKKPHHNSLTDDIIFSGRIKWLPADALFIADSLMSALDTTDANDIDFAQSKSYLGIEPNSDQIETGSSAFFRPIRSIVKYSMQISEDARALLSYQSSVLQQQISAIDALISKMNAISSEYGSDVDKTSKIVSRYVSLESIIEILHRSDRYQTMIPGTRVSTIATRSQNYRSIVATAFKSLIPDMENMKICVVGIPYGHLERLRLFQTERNYYFGIEANSDDVKTSDDASVEVDYKFSFTTKSETDRPTFGGPNCTLVPDLFDDFSSNEIVTSMRNENISFYRLSDDRLRLDVKTLGDSSSDIRSIDFPAAIVQAALRSYVEDVYGLYPHFASTKVAMKTSGFPEEIHADAALQAARIPFGTDAERLNYSRLKSTIMMHQDFITSRMVEEIEASPVFDKVFYIPVSGDGLTDIITQFYVKVRT